MRLRGRFAGEGHLRLRDTYTWDGRRPSFTHAHLGCNNQSAITTHSQSTPAYLELGANSNPANTQAAQNRNLHLLTYLNS